MEWVECLRNVRLLLVLDLDLDLGRDADKHERMRAIVGTRAHRCEL